MTRSLTVPPSTLVTFEPGGPTRGRPRRRRPPASPPPTVTTAPSLHWDAVPGAVTYRVPAVRRWPGRRRTRRFADTTAPDGALRLHRRRRRAGGVASAPGVPRDRHRRHRRAGHAGPTAPRRAIAGGSLAIEFTADPDAASTACSVDGGAFAPCTSPWQLDDLAEGGHTLAIRSTDGRRQRREPAMTRHDHGRRHAAGPPTLTATPATPTCRSAPDRPPCSSARWRGRHRRVVVRRDDDAIYDGAAPATSPTTAWTTRRPPLPRRRLRRGRQRLDRRHRHRRTGPTARRPRAPAAPDGSGYPLHVTWRTTAGTTFTLQRDGTANRAATTQTDRHRRRRGRQRPARARRAASTVSDVTRSGLTVTGRPPTAAPGTATPSTARTRPATSGPTRPRRVRRAQRRRRYVVLVNGVATGPRRPAPASS